MKKNKELFNLTLTAAFIAIIAVMCFTPLGYLKIGIIEITLLTIPVAAGAVLLGKGGGLILGLAFGISSFIQCFGMSAFGAALLSINPLLTAVVCIVPRILVGFFSAWIFEALSKTALHVRISSAITFLSASLINTVGFVGLLVILFGRTEYIAQLMQSVSATNLLIFAFLFAGVNSLVEAAASAVSGALLGKVLIRLKKSVR